MNKFLNIVFAATLLLSSCDKVKKTKSKLEGKWEIVTYSQLNAGGLTHYYDASGYIEFGADTDSTFTYTTDYSFEKAGTVQVQLSGIGTFSGESGLNYRIDITDPSTWSYHECSILMLTKDDLKIEQRDSEFTHGIILRKI